MADHILIVEDSAADIELTTRAIKAGGVTNDILIAQDASAALKMMQASRPILLLLDLNLPGTNGRHLLAEIRGMAGLGSLAVVVVTGSDDPSDKLLVDQYEPARLLRKPLNFNDFHTATLGLGLRWRIYSMEEAA